MWIKILLNRTKVIVSTLYFSYSALNWTNCFWFLKLCISRKKSLFTEHGSWRNWIAQSPTSLRKRKRYWLAGSEWPFVQEQHTSLIDCCVSMEEIDVTLPHPGPSSQELKVTERWAVTYLPEVWHEERQAKYLTKFLSFYCFKNMHFLSTRQQNIPEKKNDADPQPIPCFPLLQYIILLYVCLCTGLKQALRLHKFFSLEEWFTAPSLNNYSGA